MLSERDLSRAEDIWTVDAVDHFLAVDDAVGRDGIVAFFEELFAAIPGFTVAIERVITEERQMVVQWQGSGTFAGAAFQGVRETAGRLTFGAAMWS